MKQKWQAPFRRMLALLLCVASLLGMFPALTMVTKAATSAGIVTVDSDLDYYRTEAVGTRNNTTTTTPHMVYRLMEPGAVGTNGKDIGFIHNNIILIRNKKTGYIMSYDPVRTAAASTTGSISFDADGHSLNTYYTRKDADSNPRIVIDHSMRNEVSWILREYYNSTNGSYMNMGAKDELKSWVPLFDGSIFANVELSKGTQTSTVTYNNHKFWHSVDGSDAKRNLWYRYVSDGGKPFNNAVYGSGEDNNDTKKIIRARFMIEQFGNTGVIYYAEGGYNNADFVVRFVYCDEQGTWGVKEYKGKSREAIINDARADWDQLLHQFYVYEEDPANKQYNNTPVYSTKDSSLYKGNKQVAYMGYTRFYAGSGLSQQQIFDAISENIKVYDPNNQCQYIPYDSTKTHAGYYYLQFNGSWNGNKSGTYTVDIYYRNLTKFTGTNTISNLKIGSVTVVVENASATMNSTRGITSRSDAAMPVYVANNDGTMQGSGVLSSFSYASGSATVTVPITTSMLYDAEGNMVDGAIAGTYENLDVIYHGNLIASGYTLIVSADTLAPDVPTQGDDGYVWVDKDKSLNVGGVDFSNSGVAGIQLSAGAQSTHKGVDVVVVVDLSSSMRYTVDGNTDVMLGKTKGTAAYDAAWKTTRMYMMGESLKSMVQTLQSQNVDVRLALADFGDLDHFEFEDAVIDKKRRNWPQIEYKYGNQDNYGEKGDPYGPKENGGKYEYFANNYNYEISNQLNFVLGMDKTEDNNDIVSSQPFYLHPTKYDTQLTTYTGKINPKIYTGTEQVGAGAFVDIDDLDTTAMNDIITAMNTQNEKYIGTNYDVGLEYAYRLAYARKMANKAAGEDREIVCIFMSDGAAMQYNYFSGRSQLQSWADYLTGDADELLQSHKDAYSWNLDTPTLLHPSLLTIMQKLNERLHSRTSGNKSQLAYAYRENKAGIGLAYTYNDVEYYWYNSTNCCGTSGAAFPAAFSGHNDGWTLEMRDIFEILDANLNVLGEEGTLQATLRAHIREMRLPSYKNKNSSNERWKYQTYSPYWYFYNAEGKNWWAEAMKGTWGTLYPVINKYAKTNTALFDDPYYGDVRDKFSGETAVGDIKGKDYISGFQGLEMTLYTVGFAIAQDNKITKDNAETVLRRIASTENLYYPADSGASLTEALNRIATSAVSGASGAYYVDTMGAQYDLLTNVSNDGNHVTPTITLKEYKLNDNGVRTGEYTVLETITFGDGKTAYSDQVDNSGTNIWDAQSGLIKGELILYNTNKSTDTNNGVVDLTLDNSGRTFPLAAESFFWIVGRLSSTEQVLEYQVYMNGYLQHELTNYPTDYPTNSSATLHYLDYLGNNASKSPASPVINASETPPKVDYRFYLVDDNGDPLADGVDNPTVADAVVVASGQHQITVGASDTTISNIIAANLLDLDRYQLYENNPQVKIESWRDRQYHEAEVENNSNGTTYINNGTSLSGNNATFDNCVVYFAVIAIEIRPDTVVVDYGLPVIIDVLGNDSFGGTKELVSFDKPDGSTPNATAADILGKPVTLEETAPAAKDYITEFEDAVAKVTIETLNPGTANEKTVCKWVSKAMNLTDYYQFGYWVENTNTNNNTTKHYTEAVTVIPATSIYYEDSFVTFVEQSDATKMKTSDWTWATWYTDGTALDATQNQDRPGDQGENVDHNKVYGYDDAYAGTSTYSGSARWAQVSPKKPARAYFTFTGTGFDVISMTNNTTGAIVAYVYEGVVTKFDDPSTDMILDYETWGYVMENGVYKNWEGQVDDNGQMVMPIKNIAVDTYYSMGDSLYQVPVIKCDGLPHKTYTVEILVAYDAWFDEGQYDGAGMFDFYLDSIRIYNPAGIVSEDTANGADNTIYDAYKADGERWPRYQELRNMILSPKVTFEYKDTKHPNRITGFVNTALDDEGNPIDMSGMLFIDGSQLKGTEITYTDYAHWGPNHEVYLDAAYTHPTDSTKNVPADILTFYLNVGAYETAAFTDKNGTRQAGSVEKVHIAMRGLGKGTDGTEATEVTKVTITSGTLSREYSLSATDMYFDISEFANKSVRIQVTGDHAASITGIKLTHTAMPVDYEAVLPGTATTRRASAVQTGGALNINAASLTSLITVNGARALELLDELNKDMAAPAKLTAKYASLSFKDLIHCNIYFDAEKFSGIDTADLGMAVFATNDVNGTVDTASYVVSGATIANGMYKVSTQGIPAKNLGDTIYFKVFAKEADGSYSYSDLKAYSPLEYANFLISSGSDMDKTLAAAMLNYGAEAQKYFGYNTDTLMNADVTEEANALLNAYSINDLDALDAIDDAKAGAFTANGGFNDMYPSVSFKGAFQINYYFQPSKAVDGDMTFYYWTEDTANAVTNLTADNADGVKVMNTANGIYADTVDGIFAKDLDKTVYVAAVYQSNGITYCSGILPYSVAEYARAFVNTADDFAPFANATGIYGSVAKAYFGN